MMTHWTRILIGCAAALFQPAAHAEKFENAYLSFTMDDGWRCKQEGTEFVCRANKGQAQKEAVIIMAAKEAGPQDTLFNYTAHLNVTPKTGKIVQPATQVVINGTVWVDSLQLGSEVENYYTRYAGTVKDGIGVLFTMSAHTRYYEKYNGAFTLALHSLKLKPIKMRPR
ncbi:hypothetical protein PO883_26735 [Massilia sp. DJPM01]|uniref:hypothetical protein n=1 Tax=Massilia sp. DJPM01 TaxID=3024404 RepID=UPI00259E67BF|nr:hypothetical protein [Massilia sp. DJPM01]MDM5180785.1 hypothetical protein [Massilia sp. DJPM01]